MATNKELLKKIEQLETEIDLLKLKVSILELKEQTQPVFPFYPVYPTYPDSISPCPPILPYEIWCNTTTDITAT